jgi:GNAT superfamily N-acetyltransferase
MNTEFSFKIIETAEEAKEAYALYANVHLEHNPYYLELIKNPYYIITKEIFYNYHVTNENRVLRDKLCFIAVENISNKVVSFICGEDLFEEANPDYPQDKPLFILLGKDIYKKSLYKLINNNKISENREKGVYLALSKITTHADYHRKGLSYQLFKYVEEVAGLRGFKYLYIDPAHFNIQKLVLDKLNYEEIGRLKYNEIEFEGTYPYLNLFKDLNSSKPDIINITVYAEKSFVNK